MPPVQPPVQPPCLLCHPFNHPCNHLACYATRSTTLPVGGVVSVTRCALPCTCRKELEMFFKLMKSSEIMGRRQSLWKSCRVSTKHSTTVSHLLAMQTNRSTKCWKRSSATPCPQLGTPFLFPFSLSLSLSLCPQQGTPHPLLGPHRPWHALLCFTRCQIGQFLPVTLGLGILLQTCSIQT